jgi:hypothetical protein
MRFLLRRLGPWGWPLLMAQALLVVRRHLQSTSPEDRARVRQLVRQSGGRPDNLSDEERRELRERFLRLKPGKLARTLAWSVARPGRKVRRGRA